MISFEASFHHLFCPSCKSETESSKASSAHNFTRSDRLAIALHFHHPHHKQAIPISPSPFRFQQANLDILPHFSPRPREAKFLSVVCPIVRRVNSRNSADSAASVNRPCHRAISGRERTKCEVRLAELLNFPKKT